jgi:hypothetical protein
MSAPPSANLWRAVSALMLGCAGAYCIVKSSLHMAIRGPQLCVDWPFFAWCIPGAVLVLVAFALSISKDYEGENQL